MIVDGCVKPPRLFFVVIVSLVSAVALSAASAFFAALAFGAVALIVPGTGTPKPADVHNYLENARDYYLGGTACGTAGACEGDDLHGIPYPASFWPLSIFPSWCRSGTGRLRQVGRLGGPGRRRPHHLS